MRCLFGIAKRFLKLLQICSGRFLQACAYHKIAMVKVAKVAPALRSTMTSMKSKTYSKGACLRIHSAMSSRFDLMVMDQIKTCGCHLLSLTERFNLNRLPSLAENANTTYILRMCPRTKTRNESVRNRKSEVNGSLSGDADLKKGHVDSESKKGTKVETIDSQRAKRRDPMNMSETQDRKKARNSEIEKSVPSGSVITAE